MKTTRRSPWLVLVVAALSLLILPAVALAGPRSGGSFGGRLGFRSGGGSSMPRSYSGGGYGNGYGGGSHFFFLPGWGWGGGYGYGGGMGLFGTLMLVAVVGVAFYSVSRALRRYRASGAGPSWMGGNGYDDEEAVAAGRAYVYKLQVGLGRSARGIQDRLESFASAGDTNSEAGLASLLQQTALELLREKDSVRYAGSDAAGPMNLTNAETRMNSLTLAERSRFQVERVRAVDGQVRRSQTAADEGKEALEYVMVTVIVATRSPFAGWKPIQTAEDLGTVLTELGGVSPGGILGLEVVWTPADPNDSMTETDVMTTYPDLRSL
ncbi:MAG TPA: DUF1517 domain-containing protein [Polyangia bacterium]|jgi:uncharacterized membrane protein|nr:DUF1517 domain-containing protein [Polyangia bacterium]